MSRLPWFRLYSEARNDRKLESLSDAEFRVWFRLLCYAAETEPRGVFEIDDLLGVEVGCENGDMASMLEKLKRLRIIDVEEELGYFIAFADRQYDKPSDAPEQVRERVRRYRERKKNAEAGDVTPM